MLDACRQAFESEGSELILATMRAHNTEASLITYGLRILASFAAHGWKDTVFIDSCLSFNGIKFKAKVVSHSDIHLHYDDAYGNS